MSNFFRMLGAALDVAVEIERQSGPTLTVQVAPATVRRVAVYRGVITLCRPIMEFTVSQPTECEGMLFTPTPSGVEVSFFGRFGPVQERIESRGHNYIFAKRVTIAVL